MVVTDGCTLLVEWSGEMTWWWCVLGGLVEKIPVMSTGSESCLWVPWEVSVSRI